MLRLPFRIIRTSTLTALGRTADLAVDHAVHRVAARMDAGIARAGRDQALRHLDLVVDDLQIAIFRRVTAVEALSGIDTDTLPAAAAARVRTAIDALTRGGEDGPA